MTSSLVAEMALRAAVNTIPSTRNITADGKETEAIQDVALKRADVLVAASTDVASMAGQLNIQSIAIKAAVATLGLAYSAISAQLNTLENVRVSFDKERGVFATFLVSNNKEESALPTEERVIKEFLTLANKSPSFLPYLGIHTSDLVSDNKVKFYSVLPFYRMSAELGQPVASGNAVDAERRTISLFLNAATSTFLETIESGFQNDWKIKSFFESVFQRKNYLNNRRAPRFVIMALSNLLWNLQHPVHPETGFPLTLQQNIDLCRDVEQFLNQLLNPDSPPYIQMISNDENQLMSYLRQVEVYTKGLRTAYAEELLHGVNISDLTNSAHSALRIMDTNVFKLIYKKINPLTKKNEPNERAADSLAEIVSYLNKLLALNPTLMNDLRPIPKGIPAEAMLNNPPRTVIDLLIIFSHIRGSEREELLAKYKGSALSTEIGFAKTLREFHKKFVKPIREVSKKELGATVLSPMNKEVGCLTGSRLMPFLTLLTQDYRLAVDTPQTERDAALTRESPLRVYTGKEQMHAINLSAQAGDGYYKWALSPFTEGAKQLDVLPKYQYRLTQMTELLDSIADLVTNYRSFLLQKSFQAFLKKCLINVQKEYVELDRRIDEAEVSLGNNEHVSRSLQSILRPMMGELNTSLAVFSAATSNFERVVSADDFTDQQRQLLTTKISTVADQFSSLFAEDSGLAMLLNTSSIPGTLPRPTTDAAISAPNRDVRKVVALMKVVERCYEALSAESKNGRKGLLLRQLLQRIDDTPDVTDAKMKHLVMELVRVTASYRETFFCQASYAHTRSAKALIAALKDPEINNVLPLASIIFNTADTRALLRSDTIISQRLSRLREENRWERESSSMWLSQKTNEDIERESLALG